MEKFLLLIREEVERLEKMSNEEIDRCIRTMNGWAETLAASGNFISSEPLRRAEVDMWEGTRWCRTALL